MKECDVSSQTILFSSKAILFDILSSKIFVKDSNFGEKQDRKYDNNIKALSPNIIFSHRFTRSKGYIFLLVPVGPLLLSFGTL